MRSSLSRGLGLEEILHRQKHNQSPPIDSHEYLNEECEDHPNALICRIIDNLRTSNLDGYSLYKGKAYCTVYYGPFLRYKKNEEIEVFRISNENKGFVLDFRIQENMQMGPCVFVLMLTREAQMQGNFYTLKRMLVDELWQQVFEPAGYAMMFGRASWSENSEVRHTTRKEDDWRLQRHDCIWKKNGRQIQTSGLKMLYLRMGFIPLRFFSEDFGDDHLAIFSQGLQRTLEEEYGPEVWADIIAHRR